MENVHGTKHLDGKRLSGTLMDHYCGENGSHINTLFQPHSPNIGCNT